MLIFSGNDCSEWEVSEPEPDMESAKLIYPSRGLDDASRSPVFIWDGHVEEDDDGSYLFTLVIECGPPFERWLFPAGSDTVLQLPDTLEADTYYSWRVITEASGGREVESGRSEFDTGTGFNNPPARRVVLYPMDDGRDIPLDAVFSWYSFDPDGDDIFFDLWYQREQDSDSIHVPGLTTSEFGVSLDADTRYDWYVLVYDDRGAITPGFPNFFLLF